ncbi:MAG: hypothetical protein V3V34_11715 [Kiloniellales bacterium]
MATTVAEVTVGTAPTAILPVAGIGDSVSHVTIKNTGANAITLTFGADVVDYVLAAGEHIVVPSKKILSGTVAAATEPLQVLVGVTI